MIVMQIKELAKHSRERRNRRLGNKLLVKSSVRLVLELLGRNEQIVDQMSTEELDNHRDRLATLKGICDFYGDPDFSLQDRDDLSLIVQKYLKYPEIQVKTLTNTLLWNLLYLNLRTNRRNNNIFIVLLGRIIRNKNIIEMLDRETIFEKISKELENDTFDISKIKQILKPFIDNTELPSLTTQLLEINHGNEKEKIEKLCEEAIQIWFNKNPIPEFLQGSDRLWADNDEYSEKRKKISRYVTHNENFF